MKRVLAPFAICYLLSAVCPAGAENLTAFNPGEQNNNAYNQAMNPDRMPAAAAPKANFGNCNAIIKRCALSKCASGCTDINVAYSITKGCVQTNEACKKHGDELAMAVAGEMVASSTDKTNKLAVQAAQNNNNQQIEQLSGQLSQMQMQMQQQQAESQAQMQQALAQQQQATQQALQAAEQARAQQQAAQAAAVQTASPAITNSRQTIITQVSASLEEVSTSIRSLKSALDEVIRYARCDRTAASCQGPKRVAAFRRKAQDFFAPYYDVLDALTASLYTAMISGIDVTDIYMLLTNSCNQWGKFLCEKENGQYAKPFIADPNDVSKKKTNPLCTPIGLYSIDQRSDVITDFNIQDDSDEKKYQIACMDDVYTQGLLAAQNRRKTTGMDIDALEIIVGQDESSQGTNPEANCKADEATLRSEMNTKKYANALIPANCNLAEGGSCAANPKYAICSTHVYNAGGKSNDSVRKEQVQAIIALKSTIIVQQMKKQADYLDSVVSKIKMQLARAAMNPSTASSGSSNNAEVGLLADRQSCIGLMKNEAAACFKNNFPIYAEILQTASKLTSALKKYIQEDAAVMYPLLQTTAAPAAGQTEMNRLCNAVADVASAKLCVNDMTAKLYFFGIDGSPNTAPAQTPSASWNTYSNQSTYQAPGTGATTATTPLPAPAGYRQAQ